MQISQFLIGITFASMHLFVTYRVPLTKTEAVSRTLEDIASSVVNGISSGMATATGAGIAAWLKQAALRAAGEEGLAENVLAPPIQQSLAGTRSGSASSQQQQNRYLSGWETVPCIDTSGQAFAVWLNLMYLAPLTGLFVRFFVKSYSRRGAASRNQPQKQRLIKSAKDAAHGTEREIDSLGKTAEDGVDGISKEMNGNGKFSNGNGRRSSNSNTPRSRKVSDTIHSTLQKFEKGEEQLSDTVKSVKGTLQRKASDGHSKIRKMFEDGNVSRHSESPSQESARKASDASSTAKEYANDAMEKLEEQADAAVKKVKDAVGTSQDTESIPEVEESSPSPTTTESASQPKQKVDDMEQSWADVAKDTYQHKEQQEKEEREREQEQATTGADSEGERSSTPTPLHAARSLSPQKSKLPRPSSQASRSRSPVKQAPSGDKKKTTSIPRPANGTKQRSISSSNSGGGREEEEKDKTPSPPISPPTEEGEEKEEEEEEMQRKDSATSSHRSSTPPPAAAAAAEEEETTKDQSTNAETQQGEEVSTADTATNTEEENDGNTKDDTDRLRFKHTEGEEVQGSEAERKEGVSFADAVKEGKGDEEVEKVEDTSNE
jgi:hypothetical protein